MRLDPEVLDRAPDEGARVVALALCGAAEEAVGKLGEHAEALHDLRVSVRRLRSALRAFRGLLRGAVPRREERRLRDLARATGPARDAEVLHAWLSGLEQGEALPPAYRGAAAWLAGRVDRARQEGNAFVEGEVAPLFRALAPDLARRLAAGGDRPAAPGTPETFGAALAALLRAQVRAVREAAAAVASPADVAHVHRTRIEAKRLRYLLEPLRDNPRADASRAVKGLKRLQDLLGELHDAHVARAEAASALVVAAAERARAGEGPSLRPGLLAIEVAARRRAEELHGTLDGEWLAGGLTGLLDQVFEVVAALEFRDAAVEEAAPERRLLLSRLPAEAAGEAEELEQGWLPGERLRESVGVVRAASGERFFRSTAQGRGPARVEAVEELGREDFETYWPLTEGRRLRKRRHRPAASAGWCFDEYLDRRLVLGVAVEGGGAELPSWLEPLVVRDVTGERGYSDEALARRRRGP